MAAGRDAQANPELIKIRNAFEIVAHVPLAILPPDITGLAATNTSSAVRDRSDGSVSIAFIRTSKEDNFSYAPNAGVS
jgi:hypothetical protein